MLAVEDSSVDQVGCLAYRNTVALADTENGDIDVGGTGLESAVSVGNAASGIVVEVGLDVAS